jgi:predicted Zn-dependent protease
MKRTTTDETTRGLEQGLLGFDIFERSVNYEFEKNVTDAETIICHIMRLVKNVKAILTAFV